MISTKAMLSIIEYSMTLKVVHNLIIYSTFQYFTRGWENINWSIVRNVM